MGSVPSPTALLETLGSTQGGPPCACLTPTHSVRGSPGSELFYGAVFTLPVPGLLWGGWQPSAHAGGPAGRAAAPRGCEELPPQFATIMFHLQAA